MSGNTELIRVLVVRSRFTHSSATSFETKRDCTLQSFGHCSARCARLGYACLGSFLESERLLYLLAPDPHLDRVFIYILPPSPHVTFAWISHRARRGFLHGNSSLFGLCIGRDDTHDSCISIHQTQSFPIEPALLLVRRTLGPLSLHMVPIIPCGLLVSFDTIACVSTTSPVCMMLTSCDIPFLEIVLMHSTRCVNHADQIRLYQSEIRVINHVCFLASARVVRRAA